MWSRETKRAISRYDKSRITYSPRLPTPWTCRPCQKLSTGLPLYSPARKSIVVSGDVGRNQTSSPVSSTIIGPRSPGPLGGARKRSPGAVPSATRRTFTAGGRRSGREWKSRSLGSGFGFAASALPGSAPPATSSPAPPARRRTSARVRPIAGMLPRRLPVERQEPLRQQLPDAGVRRVRGRVPQLPGVALEVVQLAPAVPVLDVEV